MQVGQDVGFLRDARELRHYFPCRYFCPHADPREGVGMAQDGIELPGAVRKNIMAEIDGLSKEIFLYFDYFAIERSRYF